MLRFVDPTPASAHEMVFTMGLPGAGKTHALRALGLAETHATIDPDAYKLTHPAYDPSNPGALHAWSKTLADAAFRAAIAGRAGRWAVDGTGTSVYRMRAKMRAARAAGFAVTLLYVRVSLGTALARNAARARTVPEHVVREKAATIAAAFETLAPEADRVRVMDNDPRPEPDPRADTIRRGVARVLARLR